MKRGDHIPAHELHLGQEVILVPTRSEAVQQSGQPFPQDGMQAQATEYHFACCQRGYLTAYSLPAEEPSEAEVPAEDAVSVTPSEEHA